MKKHILLLSLFTIFTILLNSCSTDSGPSYLIAGKDITGVVQKGPFINDTRITLTELTQTFSQTGNIFSTEITNNVGSFEIKDVNLSSRYVQMTASGFYFNEVKGEISVAPLTLNAFADVLNASTVNVNILTHLERPRIQRLINDGKSFSEAATQAKTELLAVFGFVSSDEGASEQIDMTEDNERSAMLLAISAILQGNRSVGELSELLATIAADFAQNGAITDQNIIDNLRKAAADIDAEQVRDNLIKRYNDLGVTAFIPNIESLITSYLAVTASEATITGTRTSAVTNREAVLIAEVNANSSSTTVSFLLGKTEEFGDEIGVDQNPVNGMRPVEVRADLADLDSNTTYYFRLKAVNSLGTSYSPVQTFTTLEEFPLTIYTEGEGEVTHEVVSAKSIDYMIGTIVELTATAENGWRFSHWKGSVEGNNNPVQLEINDDKEVTAVFERDTFAIVYNIEGEGSVSENLVSGNRTEEGEYEFESTVVLSAEASEGWTFVSWDGDLQGVDNPLMITIDSGKEVTAIFERRDYELTINIEGEGTVSEDVVQAKTASYPYETNVQLTATPSEGWVFARWEGDATGSENPVVIEIDGAKEVTAVFELGYFTLELLTDGEGSAETTLVSGNQNEEGLYEFGSIVELSAIASTGWQFTSWSGMGESTENPITIEIGTDNTVTALFERQEYTLTITTDGNGAIAETLISGTETEAGYLYESTVELTADPSEGWEFVEWTGEISGTDNPVTIKIGSDKYVTAIFEEIIYSVNVTLEGEGNYSIQVVNGTEREGGYLFGTEIEITVTPNEGWNFVHWSGDLDGTNNPVTVTIQSNLSVTANLDNSPFAGGNGSELYPYQVSTIEQLQEINNYTVKHFVQTDDIDASDTENWNAGKGFKPIGDSVISFSGVFDGNGKYISDLFINPDDKTYIALFSFLDNKGIIKNTSIINAKITGGSIIAILVARNSGTVIDSSVSGSVTGGQFSMYLGGLVAVNSGGLIDFSNSDVKVTGGTSGQITSTGVGGLVGQNDFGRVENSYSVVDLNGADSVGGLIGVHNGRTALIHNSYAWGVVRGENAVGGLVGVNSNSSQITNSYASVIVIGENDFGGLVGLNGGENKFSYWNIELSEQSNGVGRGSSDGATGLTTSEMQGTAAKDNMPEFDWINIWKTTSGYPILRWQE